MNVAHQSSSCPMDEHGHPCGLQPECKCYQNGCCAGLAEKCHQLISTLPSALPDDLGGLLGKVAGGVEVFTKEAHFPFDFAVDYRAAVAGEHLHVGLDGCGPGYRRHLALLLAALLETLHPGAQYKEIRRTRRSAIPAAIHALELACLAHFIDEVLVDGHVKLRRQSRFL